MIFKFDECACAGREIFLDMAVGANDGDVIDAATWARNICDGDTRFNPLDFWIKFNDRTYPLIIAGNVDPNAENMLLELEDIPGRYRFLPSDYCLIHADDFERELYIDLNYRKKKNDG